MTESISITVNGRERTCPPGHGVVDLLAELDCHPQAVAIEYNGTILPKPDYAATTLADGDRLEVVRFVQGG